MNRLAVLVLVFPLVGCVGDFPVSQCQTGDCDAGPDVGVQKDGDTADSGPDVSSANDSGSDTGIQDAGVDSPADTGVTDAGSDVSDAGSCIPDASCGGKDCVSDGCGGVFQCNMCNGIKFNNVLEQQCALGVGDGGTSLLDSGLTTQTTDTPGFCMYIIINPGNNCSRDSNNDFRCGPTHPYAWAGCTSLPSGCATQSGSTCCP